METSLQCPFCGSKNIKIEENESDFASIKLEGEPARKWKSMKHNYYCFDCLRTWDPATNQEIIYWCQCYDVNKNIDGKISKKSKPKDTGKICPFCGRKIIEEQAKI